MPMYAPKITAPTNPLPEWLQKMIGSAKSWDYLGLLPETATTWGAGEYLPGQDISPDWYGEAVNGMSPGALAMSRQMPQFLGRYQRRLVRPKISPKDFHEMQIVQGGAHEKPELVARLSVGGREEPVINQLPWSRNEDDNPLGHLFNWLDKRFRNRLNNFSWGPDVNLSPESIPVLDKMRSFFGNDYPLLDYKLEMTLNRLRKIAE